jgi:Plant ATP synthase F0
MAQVDKVSYLPLLFWFLVFGFIVYVSVGFFFMPKIFATMKYRIIYLRKLSQRFARYHRQFKFNLRCLGHIELTELAVSAPSTLLGAYRLPFFK